MRVLLLNFRNLIPQPTYFRSKVIVITEQMFRYILFIEHATVKVILHRKANQIIIKFNKSVKKSCGTERE